MAAEDSPSDILSPDALRTIIDEKNDLTTEQLEQLIKHNIAYDKNTSDFDWSQHAKNLEKESGALYAIDCSNMEKNDLEIIDARDKRLEWIAARLISKTTILPVVQPNISDGTGQTSETFDAQKNLIELLSFLQRVKDAKEKEKLIALMKENDEACKKLPKPPEDEGVYVTRKVQESIAILNSNGNSDLSEEEKTKLRDSLEAELALLKGWPDDLLPGKVKKDERITVIQKRLASPVLQDKAKRSSLVGGFGREWKGSRVNGKVAGLMKKFEPKVTIGTQPSPSLPVSSDDGPEGFSGHKDTLKITKLKTAKQNLTALQAAHAKQFPATTTQDGYAAPVSGTRQINYKKSLNRIEDAKVALEEALRTTLIKDDPDSVAGAEPPPSTGAGSSSVDHVSLVNPTYDSGPTVDPNAKGAPRPRRAPMPLPAEVIYTLPIPTDKKGLGEEITKINQILDEHVKLFKVQHSGEPDVVYHLASGVYDDDFEKLKDRLAACERALEKLNQPNVILTSNPLYESAQLLHESLSDVDPEGLTRRADTKPVPPLPPPPPPPAATSAPKTSGWWSKIKQGIRRVDKEMHPVTQWDRLFDDKNHRDKNHRKETKAVTAAIWLSPVWVPPFLGLAIPYQCTKAALWTTGHIGKEFLKHGLTPDGDWQNFGLKNVWKMDRWNKAVEGLDEVVNPHSIGATDHAAHECIVLFYKFIMALLLFIKMLLESLFCGLRNLCKVCTPKSWWTPNPALTPAPVPATPAPAQPQPQPPGLSVTEEVLYQNHAQAVEAAREAERQKMANRPLPPLPVTPEPVPALARQESVYDEASQDQGPVYDKAAANLGRRLVNSSYEVPAPHASLKERQREPRPQMPLPRQQVSLRAAVATLPVSVKLTSPLGGGNVALLTHAFSQRNKAEEEANYLRRSDLRVIAVKQLEKLAVQPWDSSLYETVEGLRKTTTPK